MHASGVQVSEELKKQFIEDSGNSNLLYIRFAIREETFVKVGHGGHNGSFAANIAAIQKELVPKEPVYVVMRAPEQSDKWILIHYVPDNAPVRQKMLYASSSAALKTGLGATLFGQDFAISDPKECTVEHYNHVTGEVHEDTVLTWQEKEKKEAAFDSHLAMSEVKVSAVVGVPIPVADEAIEAIKQFAADRHNTVVFILNPETEMLGIAPPENLTLEQITAKHFPEREPRYVLHRFVHENDGAKTARDVFIYYCPDKAKPRLRMFYSTAKANVLKLFEQLELEMPKNVECSLASEVTTELVLAELYPKAQVKTAFKKPTRPGKGNAKFMGAKFNSTGGEDGAAE